MDSQLFRKLNGKKWSNYDEATRMVHEGHSSYADFKLETRSGRPVIVYDHPPWNLEVVREEDRDEKLQTLYNDPSKSTGKGRRAFYDLVRSTYLNIPRAYVVDFLKKQVPYQLTRKVVQPRAPRKQYTKENAAWAVDLIDMGEGLATRTARYILTCIDLFNEKAWLRPLKDKTAVLVRDTFKTYCTPQFKPKFIYCDNGGEFKGEFKAFCTAQHITLYTSESHTPVPDIENLNGQIRKMISETFVRNKNL